MAHSVGIDGHMKYFEWKNNLCCVSDPLILTVGMGKLGVEIFRGPKIEFFSDSEGEEVNLFVYASLANIFNQCNKKLFS